MRVLDLFSGIGGFSLGLERTGGFRTVAFCEIDPFCRRVLAKHWPEVPCYDDVQTLTAERLTADGVDADVICGGFPCQDISVAGRGAGIAGERSGLWREYARLIGEIRPRFALVENVAALLGRGLGDVLGDLAALGYDAEWHCIPASYVGAPHIRDRIWIVGYPSGQRRQTVGVVQREGWQANPDVDRAMPTMADAAIPRSQNGRGEAPTAAGTPRFLQPERLRGCSVGSGAWFAEPDLGRVVDGSPARVDRVTALGNALVPQIPEMIGRAILAADGAA